MKTEQKVILITGGSSGIGKEVAKCLIEKGHVVYAAARRVEKMDDLKSMGGHPLYIDVTDEDSVKKCVERVISEQGKIEVLFNNAGYGTYGTIENVPIEEIQRQFDINVFGMARVLKAVLPHMREKKGGLIINTASVVGHVATAFMGWYAASKHAIEAFTDALRQEVRDIGIKVSLIEPGALKTGFGEITFETMDKVEYSPEYEPLKKNVRKYFEEMYFRCPTPEKTVKTVLKIIKSKKPRTRYKTTFESKFMTWARKHLSDKHFDSIVLKIINKRSEN